MKNTHSARLERWLGTEQVEELSQRMKGWYGPPVPIANVPGRVYACGDGDFCGPIWGGYYSNLLDYTTSKIKRIISNKLYSGFASLSDIITQATINGKKQDFVINKVTTGPGAAGVGKSLWLAGNTPEAGGTSAGPSGSSPDNTTAGGFMQKNAPAGNDLYFHSCLIQNNAGPNCLMLYDRFFQVNHVTTNISQSVTGVPTRYQDSTATGNFITVHVTTALAASTPTYTIIYTDQSGSTKTATAQTIVGSSSVGRFPFANTVGAGWHIPLNSGDTGVRKLINSSGDDSLTLSAAMASGAVDVVLGKPYVLIPSAIQNMSILFNNISYLTYITPSSCLALMEISKSNTTTSSYNGTLTLVSG